MPLALLGLPRHWIAFELRAAAGQYGVTVACEPYVTLDASGIKQLEAVSSEHELACKPVSSFYDHVFADAEADLAAEIGSYAWMRRRTERTHGELMTRTSRLPA